jgi:pyruvate/2-oxoacid:ferredoxin oxidoreductase alpha subunit
MVILDAFFLSHTFEDLDVPDQTLVDGFIQPLTLPHKLDFERPAALGNLVSPDHYMEFRRKIDLAHREAVTAWRDVGREWGNLTGRSYGLIEEYKTNGAEIVMIAVSTPASTARGAIDTLRERGIPVGLLRLRVFRPFPSEAIRTVLAGRKMVVVLDRDFSFGHHGILHQEVKSALYGLEESDRPSVRGIIAGLGGRDITLEDLEKILVFAWEECLPEQVTWWNTLPEKLTIWPSLTPR